MALGGVWRLCGAGKKDRGGRMRAGFEGEEDRTDMAPSRKKKGNKKVEIGPCGI